MPQRSAYIQYVLLALVTVLSLTAFWLSATTTFQVTAHGDACTRLPFTRHDGETIVASVQPEAARAGLHEGDRIVALNGHPFTGETVLAEQLLHSRPLAPLMVSFYRGGSAVAGRPSTAAITLAAERSGSASTYAWVVNSVFELLPFFCLLIGLYVVFARPRSPHAWLILGILAPFSTYYGARIDGPLQPLVLAWSTIAQWSMPQCLMLFGVYFPERSRVDVRWPWVKWVLLVLFCVFLPIELFDDYAQSYRFAAEAWLVPHMAQLHNADTVVSALAIFFFFMNLGQKLGTTKGDARRRLRVLMAGSEVGLTPIFILVLIALVRKTRVGEGIPQWIVVSSFAALLLFPCSLAYVVIVQRAMDVRLLIRQGTKHLFARGTLFVIGVLLAWWMSYSISVFAVHREHRHAADYARLVAIVLIFVGFRFVLTKRIQKKIDLWFFREAYSSELLLAELSEEARNFTEVAPLISTITQRLGQTLHIERIAVFLRTGDSFRLQLATGAPLLPGTADVFARPAASTSITTLVSTRAPAVVYRDDPSSWLVEATDAERMALADLSTELLVPLPGRKRLAGVIALGPKRSEEPYTKTDRRLLQTIASQTGLALENAELLQTLSAEVGQRERISREIEIAREVQERLFPQSYPEVAGVGLAGFCRPAQIVGGDYYDFFLLPANAARPMRLALALGDISGKGISAALLMASLRASLRSIAAVHQGDIAELLGYVNGIVYESSTANRYATFFYAEYEPVGRVLTYVNAGHNAPAVLRGEETILLEATGTVVGLLPDASYSQGVMQMFAGDMFLAFTDGISEAMNHQDEEWGEERMIACARGFLSDLDGSVSAQQLLTCIFEAADRFTAGAPQHDDMTLLICSLD